ncbi:MAG: DUF502 domain-containing protein [Alphaproteobacteria bacterium]|nr:DUF502 domain-containing protein [Alphaproteobacteria bacterium]
MATEKKAKKSLKTYFLTGILVSAPLAITIYLALQLFAMLDASVGKFIPQQYISETYQPLIVPILSAVTLCVALLLVGIISSGFIGNALITFVNRTISKIPVISGIYGALKKVLETVIGGTQSSAFHKVVLIEYPRKGLWTLAFITGKTYSHIQDEIKKAVVSVYVPTTPNPTSGFLLFVPEADTIPVQLKVDEAWKIILSTGIVTPESPKQQQKLLDDALKSALKDLKKSTTKS